MGDFSDAFKKGGKFGGGLLGVGVTLVALIRDSQGVKEARIKEIKEQTLFIKPTLYNDFPQIYDEDGGEFVVTYIIDKLMGQVTEDVAKSAKENDMALTSTNDENGDEFIATSIRDEVAEIASDKAAKFAKESNMKLALARLEKGFLIGNHGEIIHNISKAGKQHKVKTELIYTNEGICLKVVKRRAAGGGTSKGVNYGTKGIDQIAAMSNYGVKAKGWKLLGKSGGIMNIFDVAQAVLDLGNGKGSLSSMPGVTPMTALANLLGVLGDMHWEELEQQLDEDRVQRIEEAKKKGLKYLEKVVDADNNWNKGKEKIESFLEDGQFTYYVEEISIDTANKLLAGEFKTFENLRSYFKGNPEVSILIKKIGHPDFRQNIFVVETFYIMES